MQFPARCPIGFAVLVLVCATLFSHMPSMESDLSSSSLSSSSSCLSLLLPVSAIAKRIDERKLGELEDQWMQDEEEDEDDTPFKFKRTPDGGRMPPEQTGPKTEMGFVTLSKSDRKETDKIAGRWTDLMMTAGIDVRAYTIEDNRILFVCDQRGAKDMTKVRKFCLEQAETVEFEWNNKKTPKGAANVDGPAADDPLAKFQAMQEEHLQKQKQAERRAKKAMEERDRKNKQRRKAEAEKKAKAEAAKKKKAEEEKKKKEEAQKSETLKTEL